MFEIKVLLSELSQQIATGIVTVSNSFLTKTIRKINYPNDSMLKIHDSMH